MPVRPCRYCMHISMFTHMCTQARRQCDGELTTIHIQCAAQPSFPQQDSIMWVTGDLTYASFDNGREVSSVQFDDTITSMALCDIGTDSPVPLIGCREGSLHLVQGAKVTARLSIGAPVTALCVAGNATRDMLLGLVGSNEFQREGKEENDDSKKLGISGMCVYKDIY
jgi:hypothetical protein